jgi:queuine tRNA-ribosyltransferase
MSNFKITHRDGQARSGELTTPHGIIQTPNYSPVGTQATVKALSPKNLKEIGVQMVLANTYHLMLRPGEDLIKKLGGLHKFMGWDGPIMTDSGGFQVFSLGVALEHGVGKMVLQREGEVVAESIKPRLNKITEEGVIFQSHLDGSTHMLSPKTSVEIQYKLGADLIVAFDDHESSKHSKDELIKSLELTEKWALESLETLKKLKSTQLMFGVVHGALDEELRRRSARFTNQHFPAIAIGGIYDTKKSLYKMIEWVVEEIADDKPRHLLGIGEIEDLFEGVERGIDLFDCVAPTRRARNGSLYISPPIGHKKSNFQFSILNSQFKSDPKPIDPNCHCYTCQNFSRAYLRHLFQAKELLFFELATIHNVYFLTKLLEKIRQSIKNKTFKKLKKGWIS